jgi:hypothetical protein
VVVETRYLLLITKGISPQPPNWLRRAVPMALLKPVATFELPLTADCDLESDGSMALVPLIDETMESTGGMKYLSQGSDAA